MKLSRLPRLVALGVLVALSSWGCDQPSPFGPPSTTATLSTGGAGGRTTGPPPDCGASPRTGCACAAEGQELDCGHIIHREGNYVACSPGSMTCHGGKWGDCLGESYGTPHFSPPGLLLPQPCAANPCDPTCQELDTGAADFVPDPSSPIVNDGANGITLAGTVGSHGSPCTSLDVTPPSVTLTVTTIPASGTLTPADFTAVPPAVFSAAFSPASCFSGPIPIVWTTDHQDVSTVTSAGVFSLADPAPGTINVLGSAGAFQTPAAVNVVVDAVDVTKAPPGVTSNTYTTATPTVVDNIEHLYPYADTVFPLGQIPPVIQWDNLGTAAGSVRVQLRYPAGAGPYTFRWSGIAGESQTLPLKPPAPTPTIVAAPRAIIPQEVWAALEKAAKGADAEIVVQRQVSSVVRLPNPPVRIRFAGARLKGTIYYQSYGTELVQNDGPSYAGDYYGGATLAIKPGNLAPIVAAGSNTKCVVCHNVAANGSFLISQDGNSANYGQTIGYNLLASTNANMGPSTQRFTWGALSPDGKHVFTNSGFVGWTGNATASALYNVPAATAVTVTGLPNLKARTPAFSPDERHVAYQYLGGGTCKLSNIACTKGSDCCSDTCSPLKGALTACAANSECATNNCSFLKGATDLCTANNQCYSNSCVCAAANAACTSNANCCSNVCNLGTNKCTGGGTTKRCTAGTAGNYCVGGTAGNYCIGGTAGDGISLASIDYDPTTFTFSNPQTLATPGTGGVGAGAVFYPQYTPDSSGVVWELETRISNFDSVGGTTWADCETMSPAACLDEGAHAELWWTDVATKTSARLDKANGRGYLPLHPTYTTADDGSQGGGVEAATKPSTADPNFNYEPTILPQVSGGYAWMIFTSRRRYGNVATMNPFWSDPRWVDLSAAKAATNGVTPKKLWVAAIDPNAPPGTDPSHPAFFLEGQELIAGNARAYWVLDPCLGSGAACSETADCCPATSGPPVLCALDAPPATTRHCSSSSVTTCLSDGAACALDSQCCGYPTSLCAQGVCQEPVLATTYSTASFHEDFVATGCSTGTMTTWTDVGLKAKFPVSGGGYPTIKIYAQSGSSLSGFHPAMPVLVGTMSGPPEDQSAGWTNFVVQNLLGGSVAAAQPSLRLTFELSPSPDGLSAPSLLEWRARFDCTDAN